MTTKRNNDVCALARFAILAALLATACLGNVATARETLAGDPGREVPVPGDLDEVLIGYFGPSDPAHPQGGDMWQAAQLAVAEANKQGGYRGKPFRLVPGWSENPWGTGVVHVTRMAYTDKVWAIIGGVDGPSTHLAEQVVAKARLALVSPVSSDRTVNLANVPWTFSVAPGDHLQAPVLAAEIATRAGGRPLILVSTDDHDARLLTAELRKALGKRRAAPHYQFECRRGAEDVAELVDRVLKAKPAAVVVVAGPGDSARLVAALRNRSFKGTIFGGPAVGRRRFLDQAGPAADGVVFPLLYTANDPSACALRACGRTVGVSPLVTSEPVGTNQWAHAHRSPLVAVRPHSDLAGDQPVGSRPPFAVVDSKASREFAEAFEKRAGTRPDYAAAHTYDAVCLTIAAVRKAGLNRARIRDALRELSPWTGVTGTVRWDRRGSNTRAVGLGTIGDGRPSKQHGRTDTTNMSNSLKTPVSPNF